MPTSTTSSTVRVALRPASPGKLDSTIYISDEMRTRCSIDRIESSTEAPKFPFDESQISAADRDVLAAVARCITTGPLGGRAVQLVGRADRRGTTEYTWRSALAVRMR